MSNLKNKVLVLGNGIDINNIKFDLLPKSIKTVGVNRIWLKHFPDYYFYHDVQIMKEIDRDLVLKSKIISKCKCYTSDWFESRIKKVPEYLTIVNRSNPRIFVDSVNTFMRALISENIFDISNTTFYIAGVSLKWTNPSHFWKELEYNSLNEQDEKWYINRFKKMLWNFRHLKMLGVNLISVTPQSNLNKIMRYENINNLYIKRPSTKLL